VEGKERDAREILEVEVGGLGPAMQKRKCKVEDGSAAAQE
jgi:hypothetical protein